MSRDRPHPRRTLLGLGLDGSGTGPASADGQTRLTRGEDYVLVGGAEPLHDAMVDLAEHVVAGCRAEGTSLGRAPKELIHEILTDLAGEAGAGPGAGPGPGSHPRG